MLIGIGETFTKNRRKWVITNIKEGNYTCETTDNKGKEKIIKKFTKPEMYKILG